MFAASGFLLGQRVPAGAGVAEQAYANPNLRTEVMRVQITAGVAGALATIYHHDTGTTRNNTTRVWVGAVAANSTAEALVARCVGGGLHVGTGGEIAVESSVAGELTFSLYGSTQPANQRG